MRCLCQVGGERPIGAIERGLARPGGWVIVLRKVTNQGDFRA